MTTAADLRTRLVVETPVETPDGAGGVTRTFIATGAVWAKLAALSMDDRSVADRMVGVVTHRATVRAPVTLSTAHRLRLGPRLFCIRALRQADQAGRFLDLLIEEERG